MVAADWRDEAVYEIKMKRLQEMTDRFACDRELSSSEEISAGCEAGGGI